MTHQNPCEQRFSYFLQELTPQEAESFERHLVRCADCRKELADLRLAWEAIPCDLEETELPPELKSQVMDAILHAPSGPGASQEQVPPRKVTGRVTGVRRSQRLWPYTAAAALFFAAGALTVWGWIGPGAKHIASPPAVQPAAPQTPSTPQPSAPPAQLVQVMSLKPFDQGMPDASGRVWLMRQGDKDRIVVEMTGLTPNHGEGTYQLWMLKEGKRTNCGTMRIGEKGTGVMTYEIPASEYKFDSLGVTLEPDEKGDQPRGKKVLGT
ncbi:anti-sigma factor [Paenibacillus filicis]|uniref:Anti-sigma-W factor RsiW n=1 Tax=Paenibacillus gyeongsangnamensis TaxID=3388067 RepID=A0ABT4Q347_9BACL|nr:anti-sigma factor [Paenibacillus filicis]MCZ8511309.1 anti-sigma factor [Paenibacillus filicis]